ncbi:vinculin-like isoform X3 [Planococcus citri]|uniref:vinculin-like isoform X3 n=1 Tax=Planococcus citri TaxID=170843 RepID=UPI0031F830F9
MPVFHTKTIESILEPVAQQVSRLVILHEEAEDGNAMPDLSRPVQAVSKAVTNLVKVGKDTTNSSDDTILKQDMPAALHRVGDASKYLEEASAMLKADPYSVPARTKLIEGSRGILQGTSSLLLCFDESEVRKIIRECKKVLDYLAVAEVIETIEDLAQFLKDLTPCLSKVSREVGDREKELTHQVHREILIRCLEQVKELAPILICSMKIFIHIMYEGGKGAAEAAENRNYLTCRMTEELHEIIRVLQLTTYDEDEWDADNLTVMKKAHNAIQSKIRSARDWLLDPLAVRGDISERSLRQILEHAVQVSERALPSDRDAIKKMVSEITTMVDTLCELRDYGKGSSPQAEGLARGIEEKLQELNKIVSNSVSNLEKWGGQQPAHTVSGRLEQAQKWLSHPERDDKGLGQRAIALITAEGRKVADGLPGVQRAEILSLCDEVDYLSNQLSDLCKRGLGNTPKAREIAKLLSQKLLELKGKIQDAVVNRVVEDFVDISSPLKHFTEAVHAPEGTPGREANFEDRANTLSDWSRRAAKTGKMVAAGGSNGNKKLAEALVNSANQLESLTPQLVNAGRIRMNYPYNAAADKHFENLRSQYADTVGKMRDLCDEATDAAHFVKISEEQMRKHALMCEDAILKHEPNKMVDHTSAIARLASRVLQVAKQEADNSEDPLFIADITRAADALQAAVAPMVQDAKAVALNIGDPAAASRWRESNKRLLNAVGNIRKALTLPGDLNGLHINDVEEYPKYRPEPVVKTHPINRDIENQISPPKQYRTDLYQEIAPPRPPLPGVEVPPARPPPPETDDEDDMFMHAPLPNQPIMAAAHGLHQELRQWSSKDNDIIAAAKKMALLMGRLSQLVRGEGGTKRDLIDCAKAIAEASEEVARLANKLARECTDKRMRTNLLQVCERIPTIGTQLKILSTVKATMLGAQEILPRMENAELQGGSEEDQEATDMLVGNAQNLMQSVKETVRAAEAASIKIRTDAGIRLRWIRRQPWYQY